MAFDVSLSSGTTGFNVSLSQTTASILSIKLSGSFDNTKPIMFKSGGTFSEKTVKVKIGGTFQ